MGIGPSVPPQIVLSFNGSFAFECRNDLVQAPGLAAYAKRLCCGESSHCLLSQSYSVDAGIPACSDSGTGVIVYFRFVPAPAVACPNVFSSFCAVLGFQLPGVLTFAPSSSACFTLLILVDWLRRAFRAVDCKATVNRRPTILSAESFRCCCTGCSQNLSILR